MSFWRGKIGFITPAGDHPICSEFGAVLPDGVIILVTTLGVERLIAEDFERVFSMYPVAAKHLATQECDVIIAGGGAPFSYIGYDRTQEMFQKIRETIAIPIISALDAYFDALRALSAKKIVIVTPFEEARNEERKRIFESAGFDVLNMKGLGIQRRVELRKQPPYASYRLAKQAFLEAPEADAIFIACPEWPTVGNIEKLEHDVLKPVVCSVTSLVWAALRALHIKEPIKGYGRLLQLL